jgi:hypothetical protein
MILFAILMLLNSTLPNELVLAYRFDLGPFPLNILDGLLLLVFLIQLFPSRHSFRADRVHPLLIWSIVLLVIAIFIGVIGATAEGTGIRQYVTAMRNLSVLPASIFIGYSVAKTPKTAKFMTYLWVICSILSALAVLILVRSTSEAVGEEVGKGFDALRLIRYGGDTGLVAMGVLVFAWASRIRIFNPYLSRFFLVFCALAVFSLPHRGAYVTGAATLLFSALILPRAGFGRRLGVTVVGIAILGATLLGGFTVISQISGRDFKTYVWEKRIKALLPNFDEETHTTVTGTRLPGIMAELEVWASSPVTGKGFAISSQIEAEIGDRGMNHNVWTSALAQYGPIGLAAFMVPIFGCMLVGYRMSRNGVDPHIALFGALATLIAFMAFLWGSLSLSINQQRLGMLVGFMFGMAFRYRAIQLTLTRQQATADIQQLQDEYESAGLSGYSGDSVHA